MIKGIAEITQALNPIKLFTPKKTKSRGDLELPDFDFTDDRLLMLAELELFIKSNPKVVGYIVRRVIEGLKDDTQLSKEVGQGLAIWLGDATGARGDDLSMVLKEWMTICFDRELRRSSWLGYVSPVRTSHSDVEMTSSSSSSTASPYSRASSSSSDRKMIMPFRSDHPECLIVTNFLKTVSHCTGILTHWLTPVLLSLNSSAGQSIIGHNSTKILADGGIDTVKMRLAQTNDINEKDQNQDQAEDYEKKAAESKMRKNHMNIQETKNKPEEEVLEEQRRILSNPGDALYPRNRNASQATATRYLSAMLFETMDQALPELPHSIKTVFRASRRLISSTNTNTDSSSTASTANSIQTTDGANQDLSLYYTCCSSLLFLRMIVPALLSPKQWGVVSSWQHSTTSNYGRSIFRQQPKSRAAILSLRSKSSQSSPQQTSPSLSSQELKFKRAGSLTEFNNEGKKGEEKQRNGETKKEVFMGDITPDTTGGAGLLSTIGHGISDGWSGLGKLLTQPFQVDKTGDSQESSNKVVSDNSARMSPGAESNSNSNAFPKYDGSEDYDLRAEYLRITNSRPSIAVIIIIAHLVINSHMEKERSRDGFGFQGRDSEGEGEGEDATIWRCNEKEEEDEVIRKGRQFSRDLDSEVDLSTPRTCNAVPSSVCGSENERIRQESVESQSSVTSTTSNTSVSSVGSSFEYLPSHILSETELVNESLKLCKTIVDEIPIEVGRDLILLFMKMTFGETGSDGSGEDRDSKGVPDHLAFEGMEGKHIGQGLETMEVRKCLMQVAKAVQRVANFASYESTPVMSTTNSVLNRNNNSSPMKTTSLLWSSGDVPDDELACAELMRQYYISLGEGN
jgi:hypothetical protein